MAAHLLHLLLHHLLLLPLLFAPVLGHPGGWAAPPENEFNKGWPEFLADEPSSFQSLPLTWQRAEGLPDWLDGSYVKNGPGHRKFGDRSYSSLLDSWGKLHKFTFQNGSATFSGRMIETANYEKCVAADRLVPSISLMPVLPEDWSLTELAEVMINLYDNTNVILWKLGDPDSPDGQYLAATDWPQVHSIDPASLAVKAKLSLPLAEGLPVASSAHWRREVGRHTSLQYYMFYNPVTTKFDFALYRFGDTFEERELVAKFEMPHMSVVHMFSNTERFAVIALYPVTIDFMAFPTHNMHPFETLKKLDDPTRFYLIDLNDGTVIDGFELDDPRLVFSAHHMNAWEEDGEVVLDLGTVPWDSFGVIFDVETMLNANLTTDDKGFFEMKRVRLGLADKSVALEDWPNALGIPLLNTIDFPIINNNYGGRKNRYGYGWVSIDYWRMSLVKKDLEDSLQDKTWSSTSHYPGESFFIPRPGAEAEDDGLLVNVVFDGEARRSYLLLLDGQTFTEVNRAYLPHTVPFSFHGNWFPGLH